MTYELRPKIDVKEFKTATEGKTISDKLIKDINNDSPEIHIVVLETYPGVNQTKIKKLALSLKPSLLVNTADYTLSQGAVDEKLKSTLTDDRVFGFMTHASMIDFFDEAKLKTVNKLIDDHKGLVVVYGVGASLVAKQWQKLIYFDITRWEIQLRFRKGMTNWLAKPESDQLKKVKRGYFFEWRIADEVKTSLFGSMNYVVNTTNDDHWVMITGKTYKRIQELSVKRPFRLVPYFDSSVWGGQWMKKRYHLDKDKKNYGWAFDGVPEENSILYQLADDEFEMPAINLVHNFPLQLLGERVTARFGPEFPIRFDYLDTMEGGNLSLQVHPKVDYIQHKFGMNYTQNESYYILDATSRSTIYLGVKDGIKKSELFKALSDAQNKNQKFDDNKYINCFPVKKHDHYSIPAGTIHCGGPDTVVLEISATPYIFTFKLWDWGRIGLDGRPRPIHLEDGKNNVDMRFNTEYVKKHLFSNNEIIKKTDNYMIDKTGLSDLEFINSYRYTFNDSVVIQDHNSVNMLNLVEGEKIKLSSKNDLFKPITIHYGETFIIPEDCKDVVVENMNKEKEVKLIQAFVK